MSVQDTRMECLDRALKLSELQNTSKGASDIVADAKTFEEFLNEDVARSGQR